MRSVVGDILLLIIALVYLGWVNWGSRRAFVRWKKLSAHMPLARQLAIGSVGLTLVSGFLLLFPFWLRWLSLPSNPFLRHVLTLLFRALAVVYVVGWASGITGMGYLLFGMIFLTSLAALCSRLMESSRRTWEAKHPQFKYHGRLKHPTFPERSPVGPKHQKDERNHKMLNSQESITKSIRQHRMFIYLFIGLFAITGFALLFLRFLAGKPPSRLDFDILAIAGGITNALIFWQYSLIKKALPQLQDPQILGDLAQEYATARYFFFYASLRSQLEQALLRLLPRLQSHHIQAMKPHQRTALLDLLSTKRSEKALSLALLEALGRNGCDWAYARVECLLASASDEQTKQAAQRCLEQIVHNSQRMEAERSLLRMPPAAAPSELMRPAAPTDEEQQR